MSSQRARHTKLPNRHSLATFLLTPLACALCSYASAAEFNLGEVSGRYNGSLSIGGLWSAEKPGADNIFQGNANAIGYGKPGDFNASGGRTGDDGRLNFRKRNLVSSPVTLLGEMELNWRNYGAFIRGKAWYDYTLSNREVDFGHSSNGYKANGNWTTATSMNWPNSRGWPCSTPTCSVTSPSPTIRSMRGSVTR